MHPQLMHGVHLQKAVGLIPQVLVVPMVVAVLVVGAHWQVPIARVVPLEVVHGEFPQVQMGEKQLDGGDILPLDGKVQLRKLILVGISNFTAIEKYLKMNEKLFFLYVHK